MDWILEVWTEQRSLLGRALEVQRCHSQGRALEALGLASKWPQAQPTSSVSFSFSQSMELWRTDGLNGGEL